MKKIIIPVILLVTSFFIFTACEEAPGDTPEQSIIITIRTVSNGNPVPGVTLSYGGSQVTTGADGSTSITVSADETTGELPETVNIAASKKFFVSASAAFTTADYADQTAVSEDIEISPRIFIPDMMGNSGIGRITAIDDISGTNRVDLSIIPGYENSAYESDEGSPNKGALDAPTAINVDYNNGVIYIFDAESAGDNASSDSAAVLIRLTNFPNSPSASLAAADVKIFELVDDTETTITAVHQAVVTGADELLILSGGEWTDSKLYKISGMASGSITANRSAANQYEGIYGQMATGLAVLPDGKILILRDSEYSTEEFLVLENFAVDQIPADFMSYTSGSAGDLDYFDLAMRTLIDKTGKWLYAGDTYNPGSSGSEYDRIARFDLSASSANLDRENFGSNGSGTNQFDEPLPLAVLPDNKLYIKDVGNQRLVCISWDGSGIAKDWLAYKPEDDAGTADVDESFGFDYFYNAC